MPQLLGGGAYLINSNRLPLPQPAYKKNEFVVIFFEYWLKVSIDPMWVKGGVLHSNFLFSLKLFLQLEMTSSDKADNHFWDEGYNAMMITDTSFLRNPHYHEPTDTVDTLDLDFFCKVVEGLVESLFKL